MGLQGWEVGEGQQFWTEGAVWRAEELLVLRDRAGVTGELVAQTVWESWLAGRAAAPGAAGWWQGAAGAATPMALRTRK